ncbi:MAG TPA: hypothetical protein VGI12_20650 [Vicinamibacterales bacterium]|jgi:hypothetical protein
MRITSGGRLAAAMLAAVVMAGCAAAIGSAGKLLTRNERFMVLRRAQVWTPTTVGSMDVTRGPDGGFPPGADVDCDYHEVTYAGRSPKFGCQLSEHDVVKVRYGADNGEIYAGVAATRLLWALGFGADALYPVHVVCRNCPALPGAGESVDGRRRFDVAAIERPFSGHKIEVGDSDSGWAWPELLEVDSAAGGAPRAQRDALRLLAVLLQHTDNKGEQQRLLCRSPGHSHDELANCSDPFLMVHDLGLTFGRANWLNRQSVGSVNLAMWSHTPVWKDQAACVGNLSESHTGTLHDPVITEEGRAFLASLLAQLSDRQLHDLFSVAMFDRKPHGSGPIDAWVEAFRQKRTAIASARCPS